MESVARTTRFVSGLGARRARPAVTRPKTALGVFLGIKAAVSFGLGAGSRRR